jgi:glycosyltransferase involved in cell wall biosynthesis
MADRPRIVCCSPQFDRSWRWLEHRFDGLFQWDFFQDFPRNIVERVVKRPNLRMMRCCLECARDLKRKPAAMLFSHDPRVTFWCAYFMEKLGVTVEHVAYSFNYPQLPRGLKRTMMTKAFRNVSRFVVYSSMERELYARYFGIPLEKIDVILWGVGKPPVETPDTPIEQGDYICALGGNARDYTTLMAAVAKVPEIPLVAVMRPHNLHGLDVPPNVRLHVAIPYPRAMNILQHSRFMVLPLKGSEVPCGHVTLVAAMHLGKTMIITNSNGVADYIQDDVNGVTCEAFSPDALAGAIRALWNDRDRCRRLEETGQRFADENCTEDKAYSYVHNLFAARGLLT